MIDTVLGAREALLTSLRGLADAQLVTRLKGLAARERRATALLVAHLAEFDTRDVYLRAGYSSLFAYCCDVLALSEHEALNRIDAARAARRFPVVLDLLAAAEINLTTVRLLAPHLTAENHMAVLSSARGKRKAQVEQIVARLSPRPDVPACIRKLPEPKSGYGSSVAPANVAPVNPSLAASSTGGPGRAPLAVTPAERPTATSAGDPAGCEGSPDAASAPRLHARRSAEVTPLSPDRYKYQLTIGGSTLEKLRLAKDMLRHVLPSADDEAILDRALGALLTELARKKLGAEPRRTAASDGLGAKDAAATTEDSAAHAESGWKEAPTVKAAPGEKEASDSRHIPVAVKRAVWVRDLGRCAFVGPNGRCCSERAFLEFHHLRPHAVGGQPTVENIELRCRRHNAYEARVFFAAGMLDEAEAPGHGLGSLEAPRRSRSASVLVMDEPNPRRQGRPARKSGQAVVPERVVTTRMPSRGPGNPKLCPR